MLGRILILLLWIVSLSGCSFWQNFTQKKTTKNVVAQENFLGTISMVNEAGKFVLIDFGGFVAPQAGAELQVRRAGEEVAMVKAGTEVRRPFAAADIVTGTPQPGDDVWSKNPTP